jgi:hypothetical protein
MKKCRVTRHLEVAFHGIHDRRFKVLPWFSRVVLEVTAHLVNDACFHLRISDRSDLYLFVPLRRDFHDPSPSLDLKVPLDKSSVPISITIQ